MSSNYGSISVNTLIDKVIEFSNGQNSSIALSQDNSNVNFFGNDSNSLSNLNTDYSSACDNVFDDNSSTTSNNSSVPNYMSNVKNAFAGYKNAKNLASTKDLANMTPIEMKDAFRSALDSAYKTINS